MSIATPPAEREQNGYPTDLPKFEEITVSDEYITAHLSDGRIVSVPLWWSWRIEAASPEERSEVAILGAGYTAYWSAIDEHLSVQGFLSGTPAPRPHSEA